MKLKSRHKWLVDQLIANPKAKNTELERKQGEEFGNVFTGDHAEDNQSKSNSAAAIPLTTGQSQIFKFNELFVSFKEKYPDFFNNENGKQEVNGFADFQNKMQFVLSDIGYKENFVDNYRNNHRNEQTSPTTDSLIAKAEEFKKDLGKIHRELFQLESDHKQESKSLFFKKATVFNACHHLVDLKLNNPALQNKQTADRSKKAASPKTSSSLNVNPGLVVGYAVGGLLLAAGIAASVLTAGMAPIAVAIIGGVTVGAMAISHTMNKRHEQALENDMRGKEKHLLGRRDTYGSTPDVPKGNTHPKSTNLISHFMNVVARVKNKLNSRAKDDEIEMKTSYKKETPAKTATVMATVKNTPKMPSGGMPDLPSAPTDDNTPRAKP